eukprot:1161269-Pelagomonas_calceolata.AAC.9
MIIAVLDQEVTCTGAVLEADALETAQTHVCILHRLRQGCASSAYLRQVPKCLVGICLCTWQDPPALQTFLGRGPSSCNDNVCNGRNYP